MNSRKFILTLAALITTMSAPFAAGKAIIPSPADSSVEYHVEAGLTFASGVDNVLSKMEQNFGLDRRYDWPISLKLSSYALFENGFAVGGSLGPFTWITVEDRSQHHHYHDDYKTSYIVPVSADVRYFFPKNGSFAPYVRGGLAYNLAGGDYLAEAAPGPVVALGAYIWERRYIALGMEAGYDGSKIQVRSGYLHAAEKVRPTEFTLSIFAAF